MPVLEVRRARPLLGTYVEVTLAGADRGELVSAAGAALDAVAEIGRRLSFHDPQSLLARLMREAHRSPVEVDGATFRLLRRTLSWARRTGGGFDPVRAAPPLVAAGLLPAPRDTPAADPRATWADVVLDVAGRVRFRRPLWLDLGGIAKGFAVDRAIAALLPAKPVQCVVNAGGDLRVAGAARERVLLDAERAHGADVPVLEIVDASVASSSGVRDRRRHEGRAAGPHVHGTAGTATGRSSFVSVVAQECMIADALTKVVLAQRRRAAPVLARFGATAYWHNARLGWRVIASEPEGKEERPP